MVVFDLDTPAPQLPPAHEPYNQWALPDGGIWLQFHHAGSGYQLRFPGLADFSVSRDGQEIRCTPVPGASEDTLRHLLLNQVVPLAQSAAGALVFHASAVDLGGSGVAFMGESRRGKSTLAAHFARAGNGFLADDGLVVEETERGYRLLPSQPAIRLWEDSGSVLLGDSARKAPPLHYTTKATFLADSAVPHCGEPKPLRRAYVLGMGTAVRATFEPLTPGAALIELVRHAFLLDPADKAQVAAQFERLSRLALAPVFYRVDYPRRFECLGEVRAAIAGHCNR